MGQSLHPASIIWGVSPFRSTGAPIRASFVSDAAFSHDCRLWSRLLWVWCAQTSELRLGSSLSAPGRAGRGRAMPDQEVVAWS